MDIVGKMMEWESGEMDNCDDVVAFFAELVASGLAWRLQGTYGRQAMALINEGYIDQEGNVL